MITKSPSTVSTHCTIMPTRVLQVDGDRVEFSGGRVQQFDHIIAATGYASPVRLDFPAPNPARTKGMRLSPRRRIAALNYPGDGCGGARRCVVPANRRLRLPGSSRTWKGAVSLADHQITAPLDPDSGEARPVDVLAYSRHQVRQVRVSQADAADQQA
nr:hypothetical protein GCM10020092_080160 [Actinoplanes digitatis]